MCAYVCVYAYSGYKAVILNVALCYSSYAHTLANVGERDVSYIKHPDPGLEAGLPVHIDGSQDVSI